MTKPLKGIKMKSDTKRIIYIFTALVLLTLPFLLIRLDINIQELFFDRASGAWKFDTNPLVLFLYNYGTLPGLVLAAIAVIIFSAGFAFNKLARYRKEALLVMLVIMLAPGFIIKAVCRLQGLHGP